MLLIEPMTLQARITLLTQPIAEEHKGEKQAAIDRPGGELFLMAEAVQRMLTEAAPTRKRKSYT